MVPRTFTVVCRTASQAQSIDISTLSVAMPDADHAAPMRFIATGSKWHNRIRYATLSLSYFWDATLEAVSKPQIRFEGKLSP